MKLLNGRVIDRLVLYVVLMFMGRLRFGRLFFGVNMLTYIGYLVCLSSFIIITYPGKLDRYTGCPIKLINADPAVVNSTKQVLYYVVSCCLQRHFDKITVN